MKSVRFLLSLGVLLALAAGYLGSQFFYFSRTDTSATRAPEWAQLIDTPGVVWIALIVFIVSIVLSFIKSPEESL